MKKELISDKQGVCMVSMFILGSSLFFATGIEAKSDMWLAIILAIILSSIIFLGYSRILSLFPEKDLFDIVELIFGKYIGKFFIFIYTWFTLHLSALVLRDYGEFINTIGLVETPRIIPELFIISICIWMVKTGVESLGRWCEIFIIFIILFIVITLSLEIKNMNIDNLRPILYDGLTPVINGATSIMAFPLCECVSFLPVFSCLKDKSSSYRTYFLGLLIGGLLLFLVSISTLLSLGDETIFITYFPNYAAARRISIGSFLQRIEANLAVTSIFTGFVKISVCLLAATKGFSKLFSCDDYRFLTFPMGMLSFALSTLSYKNIMEMVAWGAYDWKYYAFPFEILFPIIILIGVELFIRKNKVI